MKLAIAIMLCAVGLAAAQPRGPPPRGPPPLPPMPEEPGMQAAVSEKTECGYCQFMSTFDICVPVPARFKCAGTVGAPAEKQCSQCEYAEEDGDADHCVKIPGDVCSSEEWKPRPPAPAPGAAAPAPAIAAPAPTAGLPRTANGEVLGATRPGAATGDVPTAADVAAMQAAEDEAPEAPRPVAPRAKGPHPPPPRH